MDLITFPSSATSITQSVNVVSGSSYTFSVWLATQSGTQSVEIGNVNIGTWEAFTVTTTPQRFQVTQVASGTTRFPGIRATGAYSVLAWGAQMELGAYATTFIPTTTAAVTRLADVPQKTGVSSLIGQTQGTLFAEVDLQNWIAFSRIIGVSDGTLNNRIVIALGSSNRINGLLVSGGVIYANIFTNTGLSNGTYKVALAYASNDVVLYVNGVQISSVTSAIIPACAGIYLGKQEVAAAGAELNNGVSQAALFPTRLTNAQLAQLTTL
jgi:hypothetical protein